MKKYIIFAAALAVLAGCAKDEQKAISPEENLDVIPQEVETNVSSREIRFITNIEDPITRATLDITNGFRWNTAADATRFGVLTNANTNAASTAVAVGVDKRAVVTVEVDANATKAYLYHGDAYGIGTSTTTPTSWFRMTKVQTQIDAGVLDNTFQKIVLVSDPVDVSGGETEVSVDMHMLTSMICFNIYDSAGSSEKVQSVKFEADAVSPNSLINYMHASMPFDGSASVYEIADSYKDATVTLTNAYDLTSITNKASASGIFMGVMAGTVTGYTITVTTDSRTYKFVTDKSIEFKAGKIKPINIDLQNESKIFAVDNIAQEVAASSTSATIKLSANVPWTASVTSGSATLSSASGAADENIVVSFSANGDTEHNVVYEVTFESAGLPDIVVTITQSKAGAPVCEYSYEFSWNAIGSPYQGFNSNYNEGHWFTISNISPVISSGDIMTKLVPFAFEFSELNDEDKATSGLSGASFASELSVSVLNIFDGGATVQFSVYAGSVSGDAKLVMRNSNKTIYATKYIHIN